MKQRLISIITSFFLIMSVCVVPSFASDNYQPKMDEYTWTEWSLNEPPVGADYQSKTQYRYRDKQTVTNGYHDYSGYTRAESKLVSTTYGKWYLSAQSTSDKQSSTYRTIVSNEAKTAYYSYVYVCDCKSWFWKNNAGSHKNGCKTKNLLKIYSAKSLSGAGFTYDSANDGSYIVPKKIGTSYPDKFGTVYLTTYNGNRTSYFTSAMSCTYLWKSSSNTKTVYRPVTKKYQYTHYKWGDWSSYSDSYVSSSSNREVQTRTLYRYRVYDQIIDCKENIDKIYSPEPFYLGASANTSLSYSSSDESVATVSTDGYVTMKKAGKVTITINAAATNSYNAATKKVTLNISKASPELLYDGETEINTEFKDGGFSVAATAINGVVYFSNNSDILTIDDTGWVTLKKTGTAVITIKTPSSDKYNVQTITIKVNIAKTSPELIYDGETVIKKEYDTTGFSVAATALNDVSYSSSNKAVLTVSKSGWVTMKKPGTATITIKTSSSYAYAVESVKVKVTIVKAAQTITCTVPDVVDKKYGNSAFNVGAKAKTKLTYSSSNKNVATVTSKGKVTLKNPGTVTITVKAASGTKYKSATKKIKINVALGTPKLTVKPFRKNGENCVKLTWTKPKGASGYQVYTYHLPSEKGKSLLYKKASILTVTYEDFPEETYMFKIRAYRTVKGKKVYSSYTEYQTVHF